MLAKPRHSRTGGNPDARLRRAHAQQRTRGGEGSGARSCGARASSTLNTCQGALRDAALRPGSLFFQAAYAWMMTLGLMGLFRAVLGQGNARVRYLSDASYWLYLMHLPLIIVLQGAAQDWPLPSIVKLALLIAATVGFLLLCYQAFVRYTPLGTLLNGRRVRVGRAEA